MATTEPKLEQRGEQPYVAVRRQVKMRELGTVLPPLADQVFTWLERQGIAPAGAPFFRYLTVDMEGEGRFEVDVGVPLGTAVPGDDQIVAGTFPAGRYAVLVNTGPYDELVGAHGTLQGWAAENDIVLQTSDGGKCMGAMIEFVRNRSGGGARYAEVADRDRVPGR